MLFGRKQRELEDKVLALERKLDQMITDSINLLQEKNDLGAQFDRLDREHKTLLKSFNSKECSHDEKIRDYRETLRKEASRGTTCIEALLGRGIEWFDYHSLSQQEQIAYWNNAQTLLRSDVLLNEANHLTADLMKAGVLSAKDFEGLYGMRMSINGVQTLLERFRDIPDPRREESTEEDLHSII